MAADDISRDALIERVARVLDVEGAFCGECGNEPGDFYDECSQCRRFLTRYASAVVDAVVIPLVQERDRLRTELAEAQRVDVERFASLVTVTNNCMGALAERDAAIERAEAAEAEVERLRIQWDRSGKNDLIEQRDTYRDRWRQLMRDHEAVVTERDELEAENERLRDTARNYEIAMHAARSERDGAWAEAERLRDDLKQERRSHRGAHDAGVATLAERDAAREQVRQRDKVLHWLIGMDEPESEARRTVTLTEIIRRARAALEGDGR